MFTPEFVQGLAVTVDYFEITLEDAIAQLGGERKTPSTCVTLGLQDLSSDYRQAVHRNPATGSITVPYSLDVLQANIGKLETSGIRPAGALWMGRGLPAWKAAATSKSARRGPMSTTSTSRPCRICPRRSVNVWALWRDLR